MSVSKMIFSAYIVIVLLVTPSVTLAFSHIFGHSCVVETYVGYTGLMFLPGLGGQFVARFIARIRG